MLNFDSSSINYVMYDLEYSSSKNSDFLVGFFFFFFVKEVGCEMS